MSDSDHNKRNFRNGFLAGVALAIVSRVVRMSPEPSLRLPNDLGAWIDIGVQSLMGGALVAAVAVLLGRIGKSRSS